MFKPLGLDGVYLIENFIVEDDRGIFVKTFNQDAFKEIDFKDSFKESYYSRSKKDVLRGMHFQAPPYDHQKLVYLTEGAILDVILDLRRKSPTYGHFITVDLEAFGNAVFIPKGCAHGFLTLSPNATVIYNVTTVYNREADKGIHWNSFGFEWPVSKPIVSERDSGLINFKEDILFF